VQLEGSEEALTGWWYCLECSIEKHYRKAAANCTSAPGWVPGTPPVQQCLPGCTTRGVFLLLVAAMTQSSCSSWSHCGTSECCPVVVPSQLWVLCCLTL